MVLSYGKTFVDVLYSVFYIVFIHPMGVHGYFPSPVTVCSSIWLSHCAILVHAATIAREKILGSVLGWFDSFFSRSVAIPTRDALHIITLTNIVHNTIDNIFSQGGSVIAWCTLFSPALLFWAPSSTGLFDLYSTWSSAVLFWWN